ncbi:MAG: TetR/AcrR family transcriptional regulator [Gaiellaceae bacterium]
MTHAVQSETRSEQRRREVADAACRVIMRKGLERTTIRDISREGGFTSGVLTHHFPDKQAVIVGAFRSASESFEAYVREALARANSPEELLRTLVAVSIPDNVARRAEWRLWSEMWTYAGHDAAFGEQLVLTDGKWEELIAEVLQRARDAGLLRPDLDVATHAGILARLIDGAGLRAWLSGDWAKARRQVVSHLGALGMPESLQTALEASQP